MQLLWGPRGHTYTAVADEGRGLIKGIWGRRYWIFRVSLMKLSIRCSWDLACMVILWYIVSKPSCANMHLMISLTKYTSTNVDDNHSLQSWTRSLSLFDVACSVIILGVVLPSFAVWYTRGLSTFKTENILKWWLILNAKHNHILSNALQAASNLTQKVPQSSGSAHKFNQQWHPVFAMLWLISSSLKENL